MPIDICPENVVLYQNTKSLLRTAQVTRLSKRIKRVIQYERAKAIFIGIVIVSLGVTIFLLGGRYHPITYIGIAIVSFGLFGIWRILQRQALAEVEILLFDVAVTETHIHLPNPIGTYRPSNQPLRISFSNIERLYWNLGETDFLVILRKYDDWKHHPFTYNKEMITDKDAFLKSLWGRISIQEHGKMTYWQALSNRVQNLHKKQNRKDHPDVSHGRERKSEV